MNDPVAYLVPVYSVSPVYPAAKVKAVGHPAAEVPVDQSVEITESPLIPDRDRKPEAYPPEAPYAASVDPIPASNPATPAAYPVPGPPSIS